MTRRRAGRSGKCRHPLVRHHRSGVIPTGGWRRPDRGFRFRTPGWGDVNWRRVLTALAEIGYDDVLSYEHEGPIMSREDGCEKAIAFLRPLIIKTARNGVGGNGPG
jgi:sugar phosphate isomerase/epimerase